MKKFQILTDAHGCKFVELENGVHVHHDGSNNMPLRVVARDVDDDTPAYFDVNQLDDIRAAGRQLEAEVNGVCNLELPAVTIERDGSLSVDLGNGAKVLWDGCYSIGVNSESIGYFAAHHAPDIVAAVEAIELHRERGCEEGCAEEPDEDLEADSELAQISEEAIGFVKGRAGSVDAPFGSFTVGTLLDYGERLRKVGLGIGLEDILRWGVDNIASEYDTIRTGIPMACALLHEAVEKLGLKDPIVDIYVKQIEASGKRLNELEKSFS